jgi:hypothetical protein
MNYFFTILVSISIFGAFTFFLGCIYAESINPEDDNKCNCTDPNDCKKWCNAKELFTKATSYKITEVCKHPNRLTQVLDSSATCETTIEVCADCNQPLTEPKTDCR